jgi:hypothetical protein
MALLDYFRKEWNTVRRAPLICVLCCLLGGLSIFGLFEYFVIPGKDAQISTLSLRPESIPAEEQELNELRAKIAHLEAEKEARLAKEWPPLTDEQIESWVKMLAPYKIDSFWVLASANDIHSEELAESLSRACPRDGTAGAPE